MLPQASSNESQAGYAEAIYQLLHCAKNPQVNAHELQEAVAQSREAWGDKLEAGFHSLLRAAGAFAKDNDGYFVRYRRDGKKRNPNPLPPATHLFVFPVPVEPRMRVAYSYMQGIFLKYLYAKHGAIPREVRQGWAEIVGGEEKPLPDADDLWADFLKSGAAEDAIKVSATNWTAGSNIGKQAVDDAFVSESYLLGLARAIASRPSAFQWQAGDQILAFRKEDFKGDFEDLANRNALMTNHDPEHYSSPDEFDRQEEFRKQNRSKEWNTLQVYGWLEEKSGEVQEFRKLIDKTMQEVEKGEAEEVSLLPAAEKLEKLFRQEFVPRSSREDWTAQAVPKITLYLLLWALVDRLPESEAGKLNFAGWDLAYLRHMKESFNTPELRGSLKFMEKNQPGRSKILVKHITGFNKPKSEMRLVPGETSASTSAPFELQSLESPQMSESGTESGGKACTVCGRSGDLSTASIMPEGKKRHYDNPQTNNPGKVCARCVQVSSLAPISTSDDSYAIVEVPVENFLELFALYESLEGVSRLETLKTLNRVSSLSVFPNKYLLLSRGTGKGKMPQVAQYYLQLARQPNFMERLGDLDEDLEVMAAQDRAKLAREVALTLSVLRQLPYYYASKSDEKVPAMSIINALDRGRPYEALYVAASLAQDKGFREAQAVTGGVAAYDKWVEKFGEFFARRQKGAGMDAKNFRDVGDFSDYLYRILEPVVRHEVGKSKSRVSGIARKYTTTIREDFPSMDTSRFEYLVSSYVEGVEIDELRNESRRGYYIKKDLRDLLYGADDEPESGPQNKRIDQELGKYHENTKSKRAWKSFIEAVERRTLSLLLLNVHNVKSSS